MITKIAFICIALLFTTSFSYGQNKAIVEKVIITGQEGGGTKIVTSDIYFDVETLRPVFKIVTDSISEIKKYTSYFFIYKGKVRKVIPNISFEGGLEAWKEYKIKCYWEKYTGTEMNASCLYVMLFDNNLKIKDIRIISRSGYNNSIFNFDRLVKEILKSSEGKWNVVQKAKKDEWYFVLGRFKIG